MSVSQFSLFGYPPTKIIYDGYVQDGLFIRKVSIANLDPCNLLDMQPCKYDWWYREILTYYGDCLVFTRKMPTVCGIRHATRDMQVSTTLAIGTYSQVSVLVCLVTWALIYKIWKLKIAWSLNPTAYSSLKIFWFPETQYNSWCN